MLSVSVSGLPLGVRGRREQNRPVSEADQSSRSALVVSSLRNDDGLRPTIVLCAKMKSRTRLATLTSSDASTCASTSPRRKKNRLGKCTMDCGPRSIVKSLAA
eukprot:Amastigsp_a2841_27.p5 type:complete len:103 gc:universal Amastigsp_a2841_27:165-473(+)